MSRTLPAGVDAVIDDRFVIPVFFVAFEFDTAPFYLHTDIGEIVTLGETWIGAGGLGSISPIEENTDLSTPGLKLRLQITDEQTGSIYEEILFQQFFQRPVIIYLSFRDISTGAIVADPFELQRYKADVPEITYGGGGTSYVDLVIEGEFIDDARADGRLYSKAELRAVYPTDEAFDYIATLPTVKITWGGKRPVSLGGGNRGGGAPDSPEGPGPGGGGPLIA